MVTLVPLLYADSVMYVCTISVYTHGLDRAKQVSENKPWFTRSEYMVLITFAFTFIYFEGFQILTKIHFFPHSLYKILKGSKFHYGKYYQISSEFWNCLLIFGW